MNPQVCELLLEDHHPLVQERKRDPVEVAHTKGEFMVAVVATKTLCFVLSLSINLFYKKSHGFSLLLMGQDQYQCYKCYKRSSSEVQTDRLAVSDFIGQILFGGQPPQAPRVS